MLDLNRQEKVNWKLKQFGEAENRSPISRRFFSSKMDLIVVIESDK